MMAGGDCCAVDVVAGLVHFLSAVDLDQLELA